MTIGAWIGAAVGIVTLFITVAKLIVNNTQSNTRLACAVENLAKATEDNCKTNTREHEAIRSEKEKEHGEIWGTLDKHTDELADHATRIAIIESKPPRKAKA